MLPRISTAVLKKKVRYLSDLIVTVLQFKAINSAYGLKCLSHLLVIREKAAWSDVSQLYGVLLGYLTDERPKVNIFSIAQC